MYKIQNIIKWANNRTKYRRDIYLDRVGQQTSRYSKRIQIEIQSQKGPPTWVFIEKKGN